MRRFFGRAQALADLGLLTEAASAVAVLPGLTREASVRAASHRAAAELYESAGRPDRAAEHYATAAELGAQVQPQLAQSYLASLDRRGADAVPGVRFAGEPLVGPSLAGWELVEPVFARTGGELVVDAYNDHGALARRPVTVDGSWIGLELEVRTDVLELGAGLAVELTRDDASPGCSGTRCSRPPRTSSGTRTPSGSCSRPIWQTCPPAPRQGARSAAGEARCSWSGDGLPLPAAWPRASSRAEPGTVVDAWLLLARLDAANPDRAREHLAAAAALVEAPQLVYDRAEKLPELAGLTP